MVQDDPGYCVLEDVFDRSEMVRVAADQGQRQAYPQPSGGSGPFIRSTVVGSTATPFRATLFDKSAAANWLVVWHQDTALPLRVRVEQEGWGPWSTKAGLLYAHAPAWALEQVVALRVSLDDSTQTNGPLRVLPGTHRGGVYTDVQIERLARTNTPVDCVARSGGVMAMRSLTIHASSTSRDAQPRRVLHIEYAATVRLAPGLELAVA